MVADRGAPMSAIPVMQHAPARVVSEARGVPMHGPPMKRHAWGTPLFVPSVRLWSMPNLR